MLHTETRQSIDPRHAEAMDTTALRDEFLIDDPFQPGTVEVDGESHPMGRCDMLYLGMGAGAITMSGQGARFYLLSAPAHRNFPTRNEQAVLSPPWSIHAGTGTAAHSFIRCMAGDNVDYTDVDMADMADMADLR